MKKFSSLVFLLFLLVPASALTMNIDGGCVNERVSVSTDKPALVIFRMNDGTPVFAESSYSQPANFIPRIPGRLNVTAISDGESVTEFLEIEECSSGAQTTYKPRNILSSGTFTKYLGGESYKIEWRSVLGALEKASQLKDFDYRLKIEEWGIFVECIKDICKGDIGETSGWMYWVNYPNEPLPGVTANEYRIEPGDKIVWYFSRSMSETPETSSYKIYITIGSNYEVYVNIKWASEVKELPVAIFSYMPHDPVAGEEVTFNASSSYDPDGKIASYRWDFGDGKTAIGKVVTHVFEAAGNYSVRLTVIDSDGLSNFTTKTVGVLNAPTNESNQTESVALNVTLKSGEEKELTIPTVLSESILLVSLKLKSDGGKTININISKADVPGGVVYGTVYRCFRIDVNQSVNASIKFKVPKEWVESRKDRIVLMKYNGSWSALPTTFVEEDEEYYYYLSETQSFSIFAVVLRWEGFPLSLNDSHIELALKWLRSIQNGDGGFSNVGEESSVAKTSWAILALASAGIDPHSWKKNGNSPVDFIRANLKEELGKMGTADYARTILALVAANENPRKFAGVDLVSLLKSKMKDDGQIGDFVYTTIWGIIALAAVGEDVSTSVDWLIAHQNADGGFAWSVGEESDFDDTAAAIQALITGGVAKNSEVIKRAVDYLKLGQNDDGGMRYFGSSASNAASDAWTIQALVAAGVNPLEWKKNNTSVVEHLLSLQSDDGHFKHTAFQTSNPGYMTVCAIMALLGKPHPVRVIESAEFEIEEIPTTHPPATPETAVTATTVAVGVTTVLPTTEKPASIPGFTLLLGVLALIMALRWLK